MKSADLQEADRSLVKNIKRALRPPRKTAPAPETLRGSARSAAKSRNKS